MPSQQLLKRRPFRRTQGVKIHITSALKLVRPLTAVAGHSKDHGPYPCVTYYPAFRVSSFLSTNSVSYAHLCSVQHLRFEAMRARQRFRDLRALGFRSRLLLPVCRSIMIYHATITKCSYSQRINATFSMTIINCYCSLLPH